MSKIIFESALERIGRILASQYHIDVIFEGNQAYTDGKKVVLPYIEEMSDEMRADLNGYLDHEIGHCIFTKFDELKLIELRYHKELLNAIEDVRIEREMIVKYPGCALNLYPLNTKLRTEIDPKIPTMPWPIRIIMAIRDIMEGRKPIVDDEIERYVNLVRESAVKLNDCKNTTEIRIETGKIIKMISDEREEEKKEDGEGDDEKKDGESKKGEGEGKPGEGGSDSGSEDSGEDESDESSASSPSSDPAKSGKAKHDKMLTEKAVESKKVGSEFDKHITDLAKLMAKEIKEVLGDEEKKAKRDPRYGRYEKSTRSHIPVTTRFDQTTDHSGKGSPIDYGKAKREVMRHVGPIKQTLERILKVKENAKWKTERERGSINARSLSRLTTSPAYREIFKEFSKVETNNVAVELLIDLSGSMSGGKIQVAKQAALAMGEALKSLDIPFEITGFNSVPDRRVSSMAASVGDTTRFNRVSERLDMHVFKSFDCPSLIGITMLKAGEQNPDGECVAWAAKRLSMMKQKRKILIVFSDGQPCTGDGNPWILAGDLGRKIKAISKIGIEVIGIGIETESVKQFYPDFVVINELSDLPRAALGKLAKIILSA